MTDRTFAFEIFQLEREQDRRLLPFLLERLDAPESLVGIAGVFQNLKETFELPMMMDISNLDEVAKETSRLAELAQRCHAFITTQKKHEKLSRNQETTKLDKALRGTLSLHPLYPLFYLHSAENQPFFNWLRQYLFTFRQVTLKHFGRAHAFKPHDFNKISTAMRRLTDDNPVGLQWLKQADCRDCPSYSAFIDFLHDLKRYFVANSAMPPNYLKGQGQYKSDNPELVNQYLYYEINEVIRILTIALGSEKKRKTRRRGKGGANGSLGDIGHHGISALTGSALLYPETLAETPGAEDTLYSLVETDYGEAEIAAGEELFEQPSQEAFVFTNYEPMEHYITAFHGKRLAGAVRKRIERQHQYLPSSFQSLSDIQLRHILTVCLGANSENKEVAKCVLLMLFCARDSQGFKFSKVSSSLSENQFEAVYVRADGAEVGLPAFVINYQQTMRDVLATPLANGIKLPFPEELAGWLAADIDDNWYHRTDRLFDNLQMWVRAEDFQWLGSRGELRDISLSQVANHLFIRACQRFGSATATLMFGRPAPGSQARLYYTALPVAEIRARYRELILEMSESSGVNLNYVRTDSPMCTPLLSLGCRYLPTDQQYVHAIAGLRARLEQRRKALLQDDNWQLFHNEFTVYCILCQGLLTGLRPTHQGFIRFSDILHGADVTVLRDKDTEDEFHSRIMPVHLVAIQIAESYQNHINAIAGRLHRIGMLEQWQSLQCPTPFFFSNSGAQPKVAGSVVHVVISAFRPKQYAELLAPWLDLPANSHRRFLRSYLDMERVPAEMIDAYLGHGNLGEHFWHAQSTLSLTDIRQALNPRLDKLIQKLNIRAITGLCA